MANYTQMYQDIVKLAGGVENIDTLGSCMTRLRFTVKDASKVKPLPDFKSVPGVLGAVLQNGQYQLIVGPSESTKLAEYFRSQASFAPLTTAQVGNAKEVKAEMKRKYSSRLSKICATIGNIFVPLIPAYIGCGLILGITNFLRTTSLAEYVNTLNMLGVFGNAIFFYLNAIVGYNANKEFGGTPAMGVVFAGIMSSPALANITLFGDTLVPGKGGIIAVLLVCYVGSKFECWLRKYIKGSLEMFITPTVTTLVIGLASLAFFQPIGGWLSDQLAIQTTNALNHGGAFTGFLLGGGFLPLVMLGIHQSLIPIHQQLVDTLGNNPLFPILCMAGAGQVGASIAVLLKTKNTRLKTIIKSALPVGILGIGEPLIYGVTLPLFKPFIGACIGAAFGGAVCAAMHVSSSIPFGVSGVILLLVMSSKASLIFYSVSFMVAVIMGFIATWFMGFDDPVEYAQK